jgi:hypothetical protein
MAETRSASALAAPRRRRCREPGSPLPSPEPPWPRRRACRGRAPLTAPAAFLPATRRSNFPARKRPAEFRSASKRSNPVSAGGGHMPASWSRHPDLGGYADAPAGAAEIGVAGGCGPASLRWWNCDHEPSANGRMGAAAESLPKAVQRAGGAQAVCLQRRLGSPEWRSFVGLAGSKAPRSCGILETVFSALCAGARSWTHLFFFGGNRCRNDHGRTLLFRAAGRYASLSRDQIPAPGNCCTPGAAAARSVLGAAVRP